MKGKNYTEEVREEEESDKLKELSTEYLIMRRAMKRNREEGSDEAD